MAKLVFGMNLSLDGYVDHNRISTGRALFGHWTERMGSIAGSIYGRRVYELMRYWDDDQPAWTAAEHDFATAWRRQPKWVVSRTFDAVGPNATLVSADVEGTVRRLKAELEGELDISGPVLAGSLGALIDEYRLYIHPQVLGHGAPFFTGPIPQLRFISSEPMAAGIIRLTYAPA